MQPIAQDVLRERYAQVAESSLRQVRQRVATALAQAEKPERRAFLASRFLWAQEQGFIAGGRINANAGSGRSGTLINCFVQPIGDAVDGSQGMPTVDTALAEAERTMREGGGVGLNFSGLAPRDSVAGQSAAGPLAAMARFDCCAAALVASTARRGAMMAVLNVDHPDIAEFIQAKRHSSSLHSLNLAVGVSDAFMRAVETGADVDLVHSARPAAAQIAAGARQRADGRWVYRQLSARWLWDLIVHSAYDSAEPGLLFLDRINRENNLAYCETIVATNPCGEQPLPAYGACCLGSLNLTAFVQDAFSARASFDVERLRAVATLAVRMLDNVIDISGWPLPQQQREAAAKRRLGLGVTGLGDALIMLGLRYDRHAGRQWAAKILRLLRDTAYATSVELARERGAFPAFDAARYLQQPFIARLPARLRAAIGRHGIRNSHLISIAPTGSISLAFADNVSSGIEPAFAWRYQRWLCGAEGVAKTYRVEDYAYRRYRLAGRDLSSLPEAFRSAAQIEPLAHVRMLAALAPYVDAGISKTVNVGADCSLQRFEELYWAAWTGGVKGLTTFRPNPVLHPVLTLPTPACSVI